MESAAQVLSSGRVCRRRTGEMLCGSRALRIQPECKRAEGFKDPLDFIEKVNGNLRRKDLSKDHNVAVLQRLQPSFSPQGQLYSCRDLGHGRAGGGRSQMPVHSF